MVGVNGETVGETVAVGTKGVGGGVADWQPTKNSSKIIASSGLFIITLNCTSAFIFSSTLFYLQGLILEQID